MLNKLDYNLRNYSEFTNLNDSYNVSNANYNHKRSLNDTNI